MQIVRQIGNCGNRREAKRIACTKIELFLVTNKHFICNLIFVQCNGIILYVLYLQICNIHKYVTFKIMLYSP